MIVLDANILVYALDTSAPQHVDCREVLRFAASGRLPAVLFPQVITECYAVVTSARRVRSPLTPAQAWHELQKIRGWTELKAVPETVLDELGSLLMTHPRSGPDVFDLFMAAQMRLHRVGEICTYDLKGFSLPGVTVRLPVDALSAYM